MSNPSLAFGALAKPSRLDRDVAKHQKRVKARATKRKADRVEHDAWLALRERVFKRDQGLCRFCDRAVHLRHADPEKVAQCHHVVYRSAGGKDVTANLATLCAGCHDAEHKHRIDIKGNADRVLKIRGDSRKWGESTCPALSPQGER